MSDDLENALRAALRPVDPGVHLARQVMSRLAAPPARRTHSRSWMALAASLVLALTAAGLWEAHRVREGLEARQQLLQALRVTGQKLDVAYRAVHDVRPRPLKT
jgi:hypothetical protein